MKKKTFNIYLALISTVLFLHLSCATNQATLKNSIEMTTETTTNGISLLFSEVPSDTTRIFVYINFRKENPVDGSQMFADIRGQALNQVKKNKMISCPFVKKGAEYSIIAFISKANNFNDDSDYTLNTKGFAGGGIRPKNTLSLELINNNTGVKLSDNPLFSNAVTYDGHKFMYNVTIDIAADRSIGYGENATDALSWYFMPSMKDDFINEGLTDTGTFPAFVTVYSNLVHENIIWSVGIAQTNEFMITL